jgi:hypothetical protein
MQLMTANERFALIWLKIERANKHISDLDTAIAAFLATKPYKVGVKRDPETRKPVYYVTDVQPVLPEVCIILGDAIHNLRGALDHLAQQLYLVGSETTVYRKQTSFFIAQKATEYRRVVGDKVEKMRKGTIDALAALEPYKDGKGNDFWVLHSLNNIDKHRTLVAAGSSYEAVGIGWPEGMRKFAADKGIELGGFPIALKPADNLCPLKIDDVLFIGGPDEEINPDKPFKFAVALNEPEIAKPRPMQEFIRHLAGLVSQTVTAFKPHLS